MNTTQDKLETIAEYKERLKKMNASELNNEWNRQFMNRNLARVRAIYEISPLK
jgi:hypothetical protein